MGVYHADLWLVDPNSGRRDQTRFLRLDFLTNMATRRDLSPRLIAGTSLLMFADLNSLHTEHLFNRRQRRDNFCSDRTDYNSGHRL